MKKGNGGGKKPPAKKRSISKAPPAPQQPDREQPYSDQEQPYKVGRGKPPREHQWKPKQSGNPSGKRKKPKSLSQMRDDILSRPVSVRENGKTRKMPHAEAFLRTTTDGALKGQGALTKLYFTLLQGKIAEESTGRANSGNRTPVPTITPMMSPGEAAALYAATLKDCDDIASDEDD